MAALYGWVDANVGATPTKRGEASIVTGGNDGSFCVAWTKKTTDGNGTVYLITALPSDAILFDVQLNSDSISGMTSMDVGFYEVDGTFQGPTAAPGNAGAGTGAIQTQNKVDAGAILVSAQDYSAGKAIGSEQKLFGNIGTQTVTTLGAATNGLLNFGLKLWQLLGYTDPKWKSDSYALGVRLNTAGSTAGNLVIRGSYIQG